MWSSGESHRRGAIGVAVAEPGWIEVKLSEEVRRAVLEVLHERGLDDDPEAVARELGLVSPAVVVLFKRQRWPLKTALTLAEGLQISLRLEREVQSA
jgi:hypothetical protein